MRARTIVWLVVAAAVIGGLFPFLHKGVSELPVYTTGAERMLLGEEVYRRDDEKPFSYPPFFAVPFVPLVPVAALGETAVRAVWYFVNVGVLALALLLLLRMVLPTLRTGPPRLAVWFWVGTALLSVRHLLAVFQNQSHDLLILLVLVLVAAGWARQRRFAAGFCAGLGGAMKATPLLFVVPFVVRRRPALVLGLVVGFLGCSLLPDLWLPRDDGRLWLVAWYEIMVAGIGVGDAAARDGVWNAASWLNQSLSGTLYRLTTAVEEVEGVRFVRDVALVDAGPTGRKVITFAFQLAVVALVALPCLRRRRDDVPADVSDDSPGGAPNAEFGPERAMVALGATGLVACGMVLLSPMSSKSHFCVLLVPAAFCVGRWLYGRRDPVLGALLLVALAAGTVTTKGIVGRQIGETLLAYGAVTWGTFALLLATAWALWRWNTLSAGTDCRAAPSSITGEPRS